MSIIIMSTISKKKTHMQGFGLIDSLVAIVVLLLLFPAMAGMAYYVIKNIDESVENIKVQSKFYDFYMEMFELSKLIEVPYWEETTFIYISQENVKFSYMLGKKNNEAFITWDDNKIYISYDGKKLEYYIPQHNINFLLEESKKNTKILKIFLEVSGKKQELLFEVY